MPWFIFKPNTVEEKKCTLLSLERFMSAKIFPNVRYSAKSQFLDQSTFLILPLPSVKLVLPPISQTTRFFKPMFVQSLGSSKDWIPMYILNNFFAVLFKTIQLNDVQMPLIIIRKHESWRCTFYQCIYFPQCYHIEPEEVNCDKFNVKSWFVTGVV